MEDKGKYEGTGIINASLKESMEKGPGSLDKLHVQLKLMYKMSSDLV